MFVFSDLLATRGIASNLFWGGAVFWGSVKCLYQELISITH